MDLVTGSYFELTSMYMKVWENAIISHFEVAKTITNFLLEVANTANLSAPPTSGHFTNNKKIKVVPTAVHLLTQTLPQLTADVPGYLLPPTCWKLTQ